MQFKSEFDWVILQPGPSQVEMNMLKAYTKLNWDVFYEDILEVFKSDNTKLTLLFARGKLQKDKPDVSPAKVIKFLMTDIKDPCYAFMLESATDLPFFNLY